MKKAWAIFSVSILLFTMVGHAQASNEITLRGIVKSSDKDEVLAKATVLVRGSISGTTTDEKGRFQIKVPSLPVTLVISFTEFETHEVVVSAPDEIQIILQRSDISLDAVVVAPAFGIPTKFTRSPVSIERVSRKDIINSPAESYWGSMLGKKGLDVTTSSLTYKTYSTRGFNISGSYRVNQFMDGMDNQAPGLNFSIGNFIGLTEPDIESIEILPGASSALYGPGGVNGTIIVKSKNPFDFPGLTILVRQGITDIGKHQRDHPGWYSDYSMRWASKIGNRFAYKLCAQYLQGKDWLANDSSNYLRMGARGNVIPGNRQSDPNYDGVNVYGDETVVDIVPFMQGAIQQMPSLMPVLQPFLNSPQKVSRTGYAEQDLIDPLTKNLKFSGALHYKITDSLEVQLMGYWGTGNTVYSADNRFVFKNIKIGQYKLELRHPKWFLRGYTTQEDAGEAYSATVTTQLFNEAWKRSYNPSNVNGSWYPQYTGAFAQGAGAVYTQAYTQALMGGQNAQQANTTAQAAVLASAPQLHNAARAYADQGRPTAGSETFQQIFDQVRMIPIPNGGRFLDKSQLWMLEGQYNFKEIIKFAEVVTGFDMKKYILNSKGTIFIDSTGPIKTNEWGAYVQVSKKLAGDKLAFSISGRYDKNENFKGNFTPRVTALYSPFQNHHIRLSYQTAYRFPSNLQQWIRLDVGAVMLLGGLPWINDYMKTNSKQTFVYDPSNGSTSPYNFKEFKPESLRSFEMGYKGLIKNKLLLDAYVYVGQYSDFLGRIFLVQPPTVVAKPFSIVVNSDVKVRTWGMGLGFDYKLPANYFLSFNTYTDRLTNVPSGFMAAFNTPEWRVNAGVGNSGMGKKERIGFALNFRWQDSFYWESGGLADGTVKSYTTLDAQVNYKFPKIKSIVKIGGTNILNQFYQSAFGNPYIGGLYYISLGYQIL
ncbi:MAG TPA: TonB-dependent receptor [Chitinophagaceae bacterium]|nr:TonB-dependent receptor [Chitinophagaceae bacterium]